MSALLLARSRFVKTALLGTILVTLLVYRGRMWVGVLSLNDQLIPRFVPMIEAGPALLACAIPAALRPRFGWEVFRADRLGPYSACMAAFSIALPQIALFVGALGLDADEAFGFGTRWSWAWIITNVVIVASMALLAVVWFGAIWGTLTTIGLYCGALVVQQVYPHAAVYLPIASGAHPHPRWLSAVAMAGLAVGLWVTSAGGVRGGDVPD